MKNAHHKPWYLDTWSPVVPVGGTAWGRFGWRGMTSGKNVTGGRLWGFIASSL